MPGMKELEVRESLAGIASALEADSYVLHLLDVTPTDLNFRIEAGEGACEDCLAPHVVLATLISSSLGGRYLADHIHIDYPAGVAH